MRIDHKLQRVQVESFEISDELVYRYFGSLPENERETALLRAIRIGVLATMEDRFSAFLSKTTDDLGVQLENLKLLFNMKQEVFHKTAIKGVAAENDILEFLEAYIDRFQLGDIVSLSGTSKGLLKNNKTGDILAYVCGENSGKKVAIECKFDKSIKLGDVDSLDIASNKYDTAWAQLLEASVNRDANTSIIVFDKTLADASIQRVVDGVSYINNIGFVCIIDYEASDYHNLAIAYNLARGLALRRDGKNVKVDFVNMLIQRLLKDIRDVQNVEMLVKTNIKNNQQILKNIEKSLLSIEFNQRYLVKYLEDESLSKADLLDFYQREEIRAKYKLISKEIEGLEREFMNKR
ncbi:MAG TPA: hypothetical protein PKZ47_05600 [Alistipes sp.]|uniref:hypothetical protein n=1 Tax=unclassified Alistipes TaxID=2608932 RepID=UPI00258D08C4|nr:MULTISPECIES: hypothetical protein [unclassified Alistipes]HUN14484.1 hypothetical protein [Alistipes sp.]